MVQLINDPTTPVYLPSACGNEKTPTPTIEPITIAIRPGAESLTRLSMLRSLSREHVPIEPRSRDYDDRPLR
ncbi:hypothetical protein [Paraburkholderia youngii]|uniref:hypothetical protein n=1 Tax=Paraburkholderia youngii TaxID=2782701 RepID=UPI003D1EDC74